MAFGRFCAAHPVAAQWQLLSSESNIEGYTNFLGQGLSFVDFNLDGWDDLTVPNASGELHFHAGGPDGFTEVDLGITATSGRPTSVMWLDIDNDGDRDFLHTSSMSATFTSGPSLTSRSQVWINESGTFVDRTEEWGWGVLEDRACTGMAFHDVDADGDLEVMVANYAMPCSDLWLAENAFFEHVGDSYVDQSAASGMAAGFQPSFQSVWMHLDGDALMDVLVINDAGVEGDGECVPVNQAFLQQSDGTFLEASAATAVDLTLSSMTATVGDPDSDGEEEIFITNTGDTEDFFHELTASVYMDRNDAGLFEERASDVGLDLHRWAWGATWVDADLDGWDDLMVATYPFHVPGDGQDVAAYDNYWMHHPGASLADGSGAFVEDTTDWPGRDHPLFCLARGDIDGDGLPDMVGLGTDQFLTLLRNEADVFHPEHHGLTVSVCGTHSNSEAIGTRLVLHANGHRQQRTLRAGEDLYVQHSPTQFFGLGETELADSLEIFWPNGDREVHLGLLADSAYRFVEGASEFQLELVSQEGGMATLAWTVPPKWTALSWNGEPSDTTVWTGVLGTTLVCEVQWLGGLFSLTQPVDWQALTGQAFGCTNPVADNFDAAATADNGSCIYSGLCGAGTVWSVAAGQCVVANPSCPSDVNGDAAVGVADLLVVLSHFGMDCADIPD